MGETLLDKTLDRYGHWLTAKQTMRVLAEHGRALCEFQEYVGGFDVKCREGETVYFTGAVFDWLGY